MPPDKFLEFGAPAGKPYGPHRKHFRWELGTHIYIHICRPGERQFWRMFLGSQTGLWYLGTGNPEIQTIGSWAETPRLRHLGLGI